MNFKQFLKEEYATSFKKNDKLVTVFKNPSKKELSDLYKEWNEVNFRFSIYFPDKVMWVWPGWVTIHDETLPHILGDKYNYRNLKWEDWLWGQARWQMGKLQFLSSDEIQYSPDKQSDDIQPKAEKIKFIAKWDGKDDWTRQWFGDNITYIVRVWLKEIDYENRR